MAFWMLLQVAAMPVLRFLLISGLGAFLATSYVSVLTAEARHHINKIVFIVFTPALMFASLAKSVTFDDIISWWYMPVNILLTFLIGGLLGWIVVKLTRTPRHLSGLVVGNCCSGNLGNLLLIIVPALCEQNGSPFGDVDVCMDYGIAYASFSMAIGAIYIWSITYNIVRSTSIQMDEHDGETEPGVYKKILHKESSNTGLQSSLLQAVHTEVPSYAEEIGNKFPSDSDFSKEVGKVNFFQHHLKKLTNGLHLTEIMAPPTIGAIMGFIVGAIPQTKRLFVGQGAPLQVIQGSIALLGDGTIPSITLLLGGNLTKGLQSATVKPSIIIGIILVRFLMLPLVGLGVVKAAIYFGAVPADPLYRFILLIQFALPPAMNLGTMTQLFGVGESECSVIFLWTYLLAAVAITIWSTFYMWLLI
ncbi:protein PIN-LIKES 7 [Cryptomeria japonica]|uniref:protein PIN-LIKES 7 n=1 Tax=Cryptomeria japonica TaxID=3369 RepID=UPI0027D9F690|nr:protein PIN-LIKES 7 [Cryptomeria japonica]